MRPWPARPPNSNWGAILLFVLIFFVATAAANTLVMLTRARSAEFALLRRIGATRRQLSSMIGIEAGLVMVMALAIGTLAVLPALTGVAYGLLGGLSVGADWPIYAGLSGPVVGIAGVRWWWLRGFGSAGWCSRGGAAGSPCRRPAHPYEDPYTPSSRSHACTDLRRHSALNNRCSKEHTLNAP